MKILDGKIRSLLENDCFMLKLAIVNGTVVSQAKSHDSKQKNKVLIGNPFFYEFGEQSRMYKAKTRYLQWE